MSLYKGPLRGVIFDWAGTTIDHGCQAPVLVLHRLFEERRVPLLPEEARYSMGLLKKDQIRAICALPRVRRAWTEHYGLPPSEQDVEELFSRFLPLQIDCLAQHATLIPGIAPLVTRLRARGLRIGATTGYTRPMLDVILPIAARQGYSPDAHFCPDESGGGRPMPWMIYRNLIQLQLHPRAACVKVGDTPSDIQEGLNAGLWTVGVAATGNELGLSESELLALSPPDRDQRLTQARTVLSNAGAHFVIDSAAQLDPILDEIETRLKWGAAP